MALERTENDVLIDQLMERVKALDPELALEPSNAHSQEIVETENRAVLVHGRQILAVIEGRGFTGEGSVWDYDSQWTRVLDEAVAQ